VRERLVGPLSGVFRSGERAQADRSWAASILADYAAEEPGVLADLLQDGDDKQFAALFPKVAAHRDRAVVLLGQTLDTPLDSQKTQDDRERLARRQANAGVALLRLGASAPVWPLLEHRPAPRARSYLIPRLAPLGADPRALVRRLEEEKNVSVRRALLLSLGEFGPDQLPPAERETWIPQLLRLYREDADPGLHG